MKKTTFVLLESHPPASEAADQAVRQVITAWLTKELHK